MMARLGAFVVGVTLLLAVGCRKSDKELCEAAANNWFALPKAHMKCPKWGCPPGGAGTDEGDKQTAADYIEKNCRGGETNRKLWECMASAKHKRDCFPDDYGKDVTE